MNKQQSQSIMTGERAVDQVILPTRVAMGICVRGMRTRLGRSVVTLSGVGLGIAFLAAVLSGFHIQNAMKGEAELARDIDRRVAVMRGEVGMLENKAFFVVLGRPGAPDAGFIETLLSRGTTLNRINKATATTTSPELAPENADAFILLGKGYEPLLSKDVVSWMKDKPVIVFDEPKPMVRKKLYSAGAVIKKLGVELRPDEIARAEKRGRQARFRMYWIVAVSLLITVGGISNAMLMSVTERFREIATMKCLGALSSFVVKLFLIESSLVGLVGSLLGCGVGMIFSLLAYSCMFHISKVFFAVDFVTLAVCGAMCVGAGVLLAVIAGIYPARVAAKMIPAVALSSHV